MTLTATALAEALGRGTDAQMAEMAELLYGKTRTAPAASAAASASRAKIGPLTDMATSITEREGIEYLLKKWDMDLEVLQTKYLKMLWSLIKMLPTDLNRKSTSGCNSRKELIEYIEIHRGSRWLFTPDPDKKPEVQKTQAATIAAYDYEFDEE
jgi:hypothetical protein